MSELKQCPCGKIPEGLHIMDTGQGGKWAQVSGSCCGEWSIEFRTQYKAQDSKECMDLAIEAWNEGERFYESLQSQLSESQERVRVLEEGLKTLNVMTAKSPEWHDKIKKLLNRSE